MVQSALPFLRPSVPPAMVCPEAEHIGSWRGILQALWVLPSAAARGSCITGMHYGWRDGSRWRRGFKAAGRSCGGVRLQERNLSVQVQNSRRFAASRAALQRFFSLSGARGGSSFSNVTRRAGFSRSPPPPNALEASRKPPWRRKRYVRERQHVLTVAVVPFYGCCLRCCPFILAANERGVREGTKHASFPTLTAPPPARNSSYWVCCSWDKRSWTPHGTCTRTPNVSRDYLDTSRYR